MYSVSPIDEHLGYFQCVLPSFLLLVGFLLNLSINSEKINIFMILSSPTQSYSI